MDQAIDLVVAGACAVRMHEVRGAVAAQLDQVALLLEEIDQGRCEQGEIPRRDARQVGAFGGQQQHHLDPAIAAGADRVRQAGQAGKVEPLGHQEVFPQQAIPLERGADARQQGLVPRHADHPAGSGSRERGLWVGGPDQHRAAAAVDRVEQRAAGAAGPQVEVQLIQGEIRQRFRPGAADHQPQTGLGPAQHPVRHAGLAQGTLILKVFGLGDPDGPQRHILRGGIDAPRLQALSQTRDHPRPAPDDMTAGHPVDLRARIQPRHRHRGPRPCKVRIKRVQYVPDIPAAFAVYLQAGPGGQKGDTLQQAFDIGVGTGHRVERQVARHVRVDRGEFAGQRPDVRQLFLVIFQERAIHVSGPRSGWRPDRCPGRSSWTGAGVRGPATASGRRRSGCAPRSCPRFRP